MTMKIFLIRTQIDKMFTHEQLKKLSSTGELVKIETVQPLAEISSLFEGDEERILAIDPDSCDWTVPNDVLDRIPNLQAVILETTSFSWVDGNHLTRKGIPMINCPGFSTIAVAEWAIMAMLILARKIPLVIKSQWKLDFQTHRGFELRGKKVGVIGLGRIGKAVAENCIGLGMHVQYWSRQTRDERFLFTSLEALLLTNYIPVN
jgi:phosphoglycerate dehydrogenase-like enzyme